MARSHTMISLAAAAALIAGAASAAEPITLKLAFFGGGNDPTFSKVIGPWAKDVVAASEGTIKIDTFPGGTLGRNPRIQLKLVQDGVTDIAFIVHSYTPGRFPDNEVMELPGILRNSNESSIAIWRLYKKGLLRGFDDFVVPMLVTTYPYDIHTAFPVNRIDDLKGKKLRAGGPVAGAALKALGAVPVGMPITAVAESISKGIISGTAGDWNVLYSFRIIDVATHHYMALLGAVPIGLVFNKKSYDRLPAVAKAAFTKLGGEAMSRRFGAINVAVQKEFEARTRKDPRHVFVDPDAAAMKEWQARLEPVVDHWAANHPNGRVLVNTLREELKKIRAGL